MSRRREVVLLNLREPAISAESVAGALGSRRAAAEFFRACVDHLDPPPQPALFEVVGDV